MLYAGALLAATALLGSRRAVSAVEPALAGGALVVIGYGLSERLAPWLVTLDDAKQVEARTTHNHDRSSLLPAGEQVAGGLESAIE